MNKIAGINYKEDGTRVIIIAGDATVSVKVGDQSRTRRRYLSRRLGDQEVQGRPCAQRLARTARCAR